MVKSNNNNNNNVQQSSMEHHYVILSHHTYLESDLMELGIQPSQLHKKSRYKK